jgi:CspA family cold shock protein
MEREEHTGVVVWFNDKRGIGFIKPDDDENDMFVHFTNIVGEAGKFKSLTSGQKVVFTVGANNKGPQAENVVVLEEPELD